VLKFSPPRVKLKMTGSRVLLKLSSGAGSSASSLSEMADTTILDPVGGQVLTYDSTSGTWENAATAGTGDMLKSIYDTNDNGQADKADSADSTPWSGITDKPGTFTPETHTHDDRYYTETETNNLLANKSDSSHTHDTRYYTEDEANTLLSGKSNTDHNHDEDYESVGSVANHESTYDHSDLHDHSNKDILDATTASYTTTEEAKLLGIDENANNYSHPASHSLDIITETATKKVMTSNERTKLVGIDESANNYSLPTASDSTKGGVRVGDRLTITDGVLSADEQTGSSFTSDQEDAITGAASPSSTNVFATMDDVSASGSDDKKVKASSTDTTPGYLDAKVDDTTIEVSSEKLQVKSGVYSVSDHDHSGTYEPVISSKGDAFNKDFGSTAGTVCEGDDSRLSDTRDPNSHTHTVSEVTDFDPADKADTSHNHAISDVTNLQTSLDGKSDTSHNHDSTYLTNATESDLSLSDNTTANTSTTKHGLCPKLGGGTTNYLRADGTWAEPSGGSGSSTHWLNVTIDGGGGVIETGIKTDLVLPSCTIEEAMLLADQTGSIVIDLWENTYANFPPTGGDKATKTFEVTTGKELTITSGVIGTGSNGLKFTIEANTSDALSVTASGDTVTIKLADSTDSNNSASAIQTALRGLSTVDGIDVSSMTAEGNDAYDTSPPITVSPAISGVSLAGGTNDDSISASAPMTISDAIKSTDDTLSGWTTSINAGDILRINVDSCTDIESCTLALKLTL